MKIDARQLEGFLAAPGAAKAVLLYGEDAGLIRERALALVRAVAGGTDDPFRVVELGRDEVAAIPAEMASVPMTGGRRVVMARDVTDAALGAVKAALDGKGDGFLVLEGPTLAARSKLRTLLEGAAKGAAIGCYALDNRALGQLIRGVLAEAQVRADADAVTWLTDNLGADQGVTRRELEKLVLYAGPGGQVDLEAARLCVGDLAGLSLEDALYAATSGDVAGTDRALELAMAEGSAPVGVLRGGLLHLQKLQRARAAVDGGLSAGEAAKGVRPPLFFRREPAFVQALGLWNAPALAQACERFWEAERACKRTGAADEVIARSAVLGLAQRAAVARRR